MSIIPTYQENFDPNLNRIDSLLQGFGIQEKTRAGDIVGGVFGSTNNTNGIEFGVNPSNKESYIQSRNFVTGASGWQIKNDGTVEFRSGTFRGTLNADDITAGTLTGITLQTATANPRIVLTGNTFITYNTGGDAVFTLNSGTTEIMRTYSDAGRRALLLFENTGATANCLEIEMGAGSGKGIYIHNALGTSSANLIEISNNSGRAFYALQGSTAAVPLMELYHTDLDKTGVFMSNSVTFTPNDKGLVEINCSSVSGALKAVLHLVSNSTTDHAHIRMSGGPSPLSSESGDLWFDGSELKINIGGTVYNLDKTAV